jgi:hypothetical protein
MKTAKRIWRIGGLHLTGALLLAAAVVAAVAPSAKADPPGPITVAATADIHVWLDHPREIYPSYGDVVVSVQSARGCYATVFVVDTFGFVHVIHPFSPYDNAWINGGVTYRFSARELGLDRFGGRGIVHVFAIGSPYPFDYSPYGELVFTGRFGYRIYGDPYVGCRQFYATLLPAGYRWDLVGVGSARFYVRDWVRYPVYLCHCHHGGNHVRLGLRCDRCYEAYDAYRAHVNDPGTVLRRPPRYKDVYAQSDAQTRIQRSDVEKAYQPTASKARTGVAAGRVSQSSKIISAKRSGTTATVKRVGAAKDARTTTLAKKRTTTTKTVATKTKTKTKTKAKSREGQVSR